MSIIYYIYRERNRGKSSVKGRSIFRCLNISGRQSGLSRSHSETQYVILCTFTYASRIRLPICDYSLFEGKGWRVIMKGEPQLSVVDLT